jgi:hypothetical protein
MDSQEPTINPNVPVSQSPISPQPSQSPKNSNHLTVISMALFILLSLGAVAFLYYQNQQLKTMLASYQTQPTSTPTIKPVETLISTATPSATPKTGWKIYKNDQFGFEFSYPDKYKVLTDKENLYGWPKAILLLYKGGQSYDMPVEVWDTETEYKQKYGANYEFTVFKVNGKFITLLNQNKDAEVAEIIKTFKFSN